MIDPGLTELLGYAAAGLVLVTFSVRSITALRSVAIASNLMFIAYAGAQGLLPVLALHALLLPLNVWRLCEAAAASQGRRQRCAWRRRSALCPPGSAISSASPKTPVRTPDTRARCTRARRTPNRVRVGCVRCHAMPAGGGEAGFAARLDMVSGQQTR